MKIRLLISCLTVHLLATSVFASFGADKTTVSSRKAAGLQKSKQKMTRNKAELLRKKAEQDAKRHQVESQRREYQLMLEAQRRGMEQTRQQQMQQR